MKSETLTLVLVNLAGIMETADESLLPGVYKEVGAALHTDPNGLGSLTLFPLIVQYLCYPLATYLVVRHSRAHVIAIGAFLWVVVIFHGMNGIGIVIVTPAIQSFVVDSTDNHNRSVAFGWLQVTGNVRSILGGLFSVLLAFTSFMGIAGWRISFHVIAIISIIFGIIVGLFSKDPRFVNKSITDGSSLGKSLLLEGVSGSFTWPALSFAPMWLELIGFTYKETTLLMGMFTVATSIGALFRGKMGDVFSFLFPNAGRIILSQISSGSSTPLAWILLLGLPDDPSTGFKHGLVLFIMEIIPEKYKTSMYALDQSFEDVLASFAPPVVGLLSQHAFENVASLAMELYTSIAIPMALYCFIYTFLYHTYPKDRDGSKMNSENLPIAGEYSQVQLYGKETVIELDYGEEHGLEVDESDDKTLLTHK
ncbi:hypothetical protein MKX01_025335 [Papaver californicum]|nr:hypothetical protein MKX01_025335 [Papaver californicum]